MVMTDGFQRYRCFMFLKSCGHRAWKIRWEKDSRLLKKYHCLHSMHIIRRWVDTPCLILWFTQLAPTPLFHNILQNVGTCYILYGKCKYSNWFYKCVIYEETITNAQLAEGYELHTHPKPTYLLYIVIYVPIKLCFHDIYTNSCSEL